MFGPREVLLTSDEPVVEQFLNGRRLGPIGMSEEKDQVKTSDAQETQGVKPQSSAGLTAKETEEMERSAGAP